MERTNEVGMNKNTHCPVNPFISGTHELSALKVTVIQECQWGLNKQVSCLCKNEICVLDKKAMWSSCRADYTEAWFKVSLDGEIWDIYCWWIISDSFLFSFLTRVESSQIKETRTKTYYYTIFL